MRGSILLLLLVVPPTSARAQRDPRVRTGAQVRVSTSQSLAIGKVASIDADSIVVDRGAADSLKLAVNDITALEVYRRGKGAQTSGIVVGTLGAVSGAALYINWCLRNLETCRYLEADDGVDDPDDGDDEDEDESFSMFGLVTLGFGAIGYAIGYALVPPRWEIVDLPLRIGLAPMRRGVGVYVSLPAPRFARGAR